LGKHDAKLHDDGSAPSVDVTGIIVAVRPQA